MAVACLFPIPITLPVEDDIAGGIEIGESVALVEAETGESMATMEVTEKYTIDRDLENEHVYRTTDPEHPGVAKVLAQGGVNLAGPVKVLSEGEYPEKYPDLYIRPIQSRSVRDGGQCPDSSRRRRCEE